MQNFLRENLGLFTVMAEEDPEYRRLQLLQDAGIIPIIHPEQRQQPRVPQQPAPRI